jgi:hypothetical protein
MLHSEEEEEEEEERRDMVDSLDGVIVPESGAIRPRTKSSDILLAIHFHTHTVHTSCHCFSGLLIILLPSRRGIREQRE